MARTQRPPFLGAENPLQVRGGGGRKAGAQAIAKKGGSIIFTKATPPPRGVRCLAGSCAGGAMSTKPKIRSPFLSISALSHQVGQTIIPLVTCNSCTLPWEIQLLFPHCRTMPRNEDCLDKTTSRMLASLRFTQVPGAYHVAAWLNQRRVADSQRPSIGTAQGSRCEPDGPFRCDHQWGSSAGGWIRLTRAEAASRSRHAV
jgi:hypothetical protein